MLRGHSSRVEEEDRSPLVELPHNHGDSFLDVRMVGPVARHNFALDASQRDWRKVLVGDMYRGKEVAVVVRGHGNQSAGTGSTYSADSRIVTKSQLNRRPGSMARCLMPADRIRASTRRTISNSGPRI